MAGFDNGTLYGGIFAQTKQFGTILRGFGPPVPQAGYIGDIYIDVVTWQVFNKRSTSPDGDVDPWGHYLFVLPAPYRTALKFFSAAQPTPDIGGPGDYCLQWSSSGNYGMMPGVYGPKQATDWPENGNGPDTVIGGDGTIGQIGLLDEGASLPESNSTQLIALGLLAEVIFPLAVMEAVGSTVGQVGVQSGAVPISPTLNPLYTAEDAHLI